MDPEELERCAGDDAGHRTVAVACKKKHLRPIGRARQVLMLTSVCAIVGRSCLTFQVGLAAWRPHHHLCLQRATRLSTPRLSLQPFRSFASRRAGSNTLFNFVQLKLAWHLTRAQIPSQYVVYRSYSGDPWSTLHPLSQSESG